MILPLVLGEGEPPGLLGLFSGTPRRFRPSQVELLSLLSPGLASAVRNASVMDRLRRRARDLAGEMREVDAQMELAREVQRHLMPEAPPHVEGLTVGAFWRPASRVGGDLLDFRVLTGRGLAVLLADVSGKGVAAAMLGGLTRGLLLGIAGDAASPGRVLTRLNGLLATELAWDRFVTAAYVRFEPGRRLLVHGSAGHEPLLHFRARLGRVEPLGAPSLPLGVDGSTEYDDRTHELESGDCFLMFTDGAYRRGEVGGASRLGRTLAELAPRHADAVSLAAALERRVCGRRPLYDDVACVVVRVS